MEAAGVATTETAAWGPGGGETEGGGSLPGAGERALELGTEAQPPETKAATRLKTASATGAKAIVRTRESGFKVQIPRFLPDGALISKAFSL